MGTQHNDDASGLRDADKHGNRLTYADKYFHGNEHCNADEYGNRYKYSDEYSDCLTFADEHVYSNTDRYLRWVRLLKPRCHHDQR